jgi:hypothetical protein
MVIANAGYIRKLALVKAICKSASKLFYDDHKFTTAQGN